MKFGQRVKVTHSLERKKMPTLRLINKGHRAVLKEWIPEENHFTGIFLGKRRICDGFYGNGKQKVRSWHDVYLVAWHPDRSPVYVLPQHCEPEEPQHNKVLNKIQGNIESLGVLLSEISELLPRRK